MLQMKQSQELSEQMQKVNVQENLKKKTYTEKSFHYDVPHIYAKITAAGLRRMTVLMFHSIIQRDIPLFFFLDSERTQHV